MKGLHTWVAVVGIGLAGGGTWWWQQRDAASSGAASVADAASGGSRSAPGPAGAAAGGAGGGPAAVEVGLAEVVRIEDDAQAVGSVRARQGVVVRPEVSGRIVKLGFNDGQRVKRGQVLVQLDDALQRAQLLQAEAQASIARTNLKRNRELVADNFISQSAVDQTEASLQVAEAQVALAQAQLERMRILAPFDGVAGIGLVDIGDYVKDGADIVNLEDLSAVLLDFRLAERYVGRLKVGQPVEAQLDAMPGRSFKGQVEAVDSLVDADGRSLLVRARLPNAGGEFKTGMFARTRVVFSVREQAVVVPEEALVPQGGKQYLMLVADGPQGPVSRRIEARLGLRLPGKVEILEGVKAGDRVVTAGQARLMRGDALPLRVVDLSKPGGAAARGPGAAASGAAPGGSGAGAGTGAGAGDGAAGRSLVPAAAPAASVPASNARAA